MNTEVNKPLMLRIIDGGYPKNEIFNHESDLYVFVTPLTKKIIEEWCKEHNFNRTWHCPNFIDQITKRPMYDCAFQFIKGVL